MGDRQESMGNGQETLEELSNSQETLVDRQESMGNGQETLEETLSNSQETLGDRQETLAQDTLGQETLTLECSKAWHAAVS
jgi:hypothetical protein